MSYPPATLISRVVAVLGLLVLAAAPARAQLVAAEPPESVSFLSRYDFLMSAAALGYDDERFSWDTHWAGNIDVIDYRKGRITLLSDLQGILGSQFRPFDPYQSNYLLEASGSVRLRKVEAVLVLNHISRHLGDRFKRIAVAENSLGIRGLSKLALSPTTTLDVRADFRKVIAVAYVDYTTMTEVDLVLRRKFNEHTGVYGRGYGSGISVDKTIANRDFQYGGRAEAGIRLTGDRASVDFFAGFEKVIDADVLDRQARRWAFFGFRIIAR
jgi:hypothetical protein